MFIHAANPSYELVFRLTSDQTEVTSTSHPCVTPPLTRILDELMEPSKETKELCFSPNLYPLLDKGFPILTVSDV